MRREEQDLQAIWREWLRRVIATAPIGLRKPTPFAEAAGIAPSTVTRALDEDNPGHLSLRTIQKIVAHYDVAPPRGFGLENGHASLSEQELELATPGGPCVPETPSQSCWRIKTPALALLGLMPGDLVTIDEEAALTPGSIVCADIFNPELGGAEPVIRRYMPPYLVAASADPNFAKAPIRIDDTAVKLRGVVLRSYRDYFAA